MADQDDEGFTAYRLLIDDNIRDLKDAVKTLSATQAELDKQLALVQQKLLIYSGGAAIFIGGAIQLAGQYVAG